MLPKYHFPFTDTGMYGRAVRLIRQHGHSKGVHLDFGCGCAAIAPHINRANVEYVGFDFDEVSIEFVRARGFVAHRIDLQNLAAAQQIVMAAVADRPIASVSILDTLEHVSNPDEILAFLRNLVAATLAPVIISIPNVAHYDVGAKLAFGAWDITETGLLDHTHLQCFTAPSLERMVRRAGFVLAAADDLQDPVSDQRFPAGHPALTPGTSLCQFLNGLRHQAAPHADTYQFVRAYLPTYPAADQPRFIERNSGHKPFLTVVTRTQGTRLHLLSEALLSLAAQTDQDFEVLVVGHGADGARAKQIDRVIAEFPQSFRLRVRLLADDASGKGSPLNRAFEAARGEYVAILDDDNVVFGHWVETFHALAGPGCGQVLRAVVVEQDIHVGREADGTEHVVARSWFRRSYPATYDLLAHLAANRTPIHGLALPRGVFRDLGLRFDASLQTAADWDFHIRAVLLVGVACSSEIVGNYRRWSEPDSAATDHPSDEVVADQQRMLLKLDSQPVLLPAGTTRQIRELLSQRDELLRQLDSLNQVTRCREPAAADDQTAHRHQNRLPLRWAKQAMRSTRLWLGL